MGSARFIWLDAMGVIFEAADDARALLVPFARSRGCAMDTEQIVDVYRQCSLGAFSSGELWRRLCVVGDPTVLDAELLMGHRVTPGIVAFVDAARRLRVRVGCISNDVAGWAAWLRVRHGFEGLITPWITSAEVGSRKPDRAIYDRACQAAAVSPRECVVVDDREPNLDAARQLGFATVRFGEPSPRHDTAASAAALSRLLLGAPA